MARHIDVADLLQWPILQSHLWFAATQAWQAAWLAAAMAS
jgi:hypothetical protein